ncbi:MAG TPA: CHAT domain-containing protein [Vicinamibacterales bacterium]
MNALVQLRQRPSNGASFRVLAVGNPKVDARRGAADQRGTAERDLENLSLLAPLPFAEQELHAIGRAFPDRTLIMSGTGARESALRETGMAQYTVLHFATHGLVSDAQSRRSGLLLAPGKGEDGLLQMAEIYSLELNANLVVISARQTAPGREMTGERMIGLSRAFFYAGARSVVAPLWNLDPRFAAEFVERFYRELSQGRSAEEALRNTKLAYVTHPEYSHPFYWSSLVMLGDGTTAVLEQPVRWPIGHAAAAVASTLTALAVAVVNLRQRG